MQLCQLLEGRRCEDVMVCSQNHRVEPDQRYQTNNFKTAEKEEDNDVHIDEKEEDNDVAEPDVLRLVLLEPVVIAKEM